MRAIAFWIPTLLLCVGLGLGGLGGLSGNPEQVETIKALGYPAYLPAFLGVLKLLGVAALLAPGAARLKEWAYAGIVFDLSGAAYSHLHVGHSLGETSPALIMLALALVSYGLRPRSRGGWFDDADGCH